MVISVYPSYPKDATAEGMSSTLIASYCWTQDAERIGALINDDGTAKQGLIDLVLRDLAAIHDVSVEWLRKYYTPGDHFAWNWSSNPLTMGSSFLTSGQFDSFEWLFQVDLRSLARVIGAVISTNSLSCLLRTVNSSLLVRRPAPAMRM